MTTKTRPKNIDNLFNTTANEVGKEQLQKAQKEIKALRSRLDMIDEVIERVYKEGCYGAQMIPADYAHSMIQKAHEVSHLLAMANGAALVRGKID